VLADGDGLQDPSSADGDRYSSGCRALRVLIHDYCGHPFQVQLSRELARRGHRTFHLHFADFQTPKADLVLRDCDPSTLAIEGISLGRTFQKDSLIRRWRQERLYARRLVAAVEAFAPDLVLSANAPLEVQRMLMLDCRRRSIRFVPWVQDFYSVAVRTVLSRRVGWLLGAAIGSYYRHLERSILNRCDEVIYISHDFLDHTIGWNIEPSKCHVVENWAPVRELAPRPRDNQWARRHGLLDKTCLLYSGTLGYKHNPRLLLELAEAFRADDGVVVVCIAAGPGREWLETQRSAYDLSNLVIMDLQPYAELPDALATGDALIALIEQEAGTFAVPSKVLSYLCAARPLLLAVPHSNLAAQTVKRAGAGLVTEPTDVDGFVTAARRLVADPELRSHLATNGRRYAETTFDITSITDRFENIFMLAMGTSGSAAFAVRQQTDRHNDGRAAPWTKTNPCS
jgi:colanic acid biosynthesis glycosyl transferase WcaI